MLELLRHRTAGSLWRLSTACGRTIEVTGDHNFFVLRGGRLQLVRTEEIQLGDYVPLPRSLPEPDEPCVDLPVADFLTENDRIYVEWPSLPRVSPEPRALVRSLLSPSHAIEVVGGRRVPIDTYRRAVATVPALADDARFGTPVRGFTAPARLQLSDAVLRFIGYYLGEGYAHQRGIALSSNDPEVIQDFTETVCALSLRCRHVPTTYDYFIASTLWSRLFARWCGHGVRSKRLPLFWSQLSNGQLAQLLRAYFSADGGVAHDDVTCTTASRALASEICYALLRFGIVARMRERWMKVPGRNDRRPYWYVRISGQPSLRAFRAQIGFAIAAKNTRLDTLLSRPDNSKRRHHPSRRGGSSSAAH